MTDKRPVVLFKHPKAPRHSPFLSKKEKEWKRILSSSRLQSSFGAHSTSRPRHSYCQHSKPTQQLRYANKVQRYRFHSKLIQTWVDVEHRMRCARSPRLGLPSNVSHADGCAQSDQPPTVINLIIQDHRPDNQHYCMTLCQEVVSTALATLGEKQMLTRLRFHDPPSYNKSYTHAMPTY